MISPALHVVKVASFMEKCNVIPATSDFNKKEYDIIGIKNLKRVNSTLCFLSFDKM